MPLSSSTFEFAYKNKLKLKETEYEVNSRFGIIRFKQ